MSADFCGELADAFGVSEISFHQNVGDGDLEAVSLEQADAADGAIERTGDFGDTVVDLGAVRVDADLNLLDVEFAKAACFPFADEDGVGFQFYVEAERAGVLDDFENVRTYQWFAAADGEKEDACGCELIESGFDFGGGHFAVAVVLEIAVFAALVAAIGDVEMDGERDATFESFAIEIGDEAHVCV